MALSRDDRVPRAEEMARRLAADGFPVTMAAVRAQTTDATTLGRPHIADALVAAGVFASRDQAFARAGRRLDLLRRPPQQRPRAVRLCARRRRPVLAHPRVTGGVRRGHHPLAEAGLLGLESTIPSTTGPPGAALRRSRRSGADGDRGQRLPRQAAVDRLGAETPIPRSTPPCWPRPAGRPRSWHERADWKFFVEFFVPCSSSSTRSHGAAVISLTSGRTRKARRRLSPGGGGLDVSHRRSRCSAQCICATSAHAAAQQARRRVVAALVALELLTGKAEHPPRPRTSRPLVPWAPRCWPARVRSRRRSCS